MFALLEESPKNWTWRSHDNFWASICWPSSHTRVTSVNSLSSRSSPNAELILSLKSVHCRQSFSDISTREELFFKYLVLSIPMTLGFQFEKIKSNTNKGRQWSDQGRKKNWKLPPPPIRQSKQAGKQWSACAMREREGGQRESCLERFREICFETMVAGLYW